MPTLPVSLKFEPPLGRCRLVDHRHLQPAHLEFMRRETNARRPSAVAILAASAAGLAACALVWLLLKPAVVDPAPIAAVIRERGLLDDQRLPPPEAVFATLLSHKRLRQAAHQAGFAASDIDAVEKLRRHLRVDVGDADEAGVQTIAVRWTGQPSEQAVLLVNALARRCLEELAETHRALYESAHAAAECQVSDASRTLSDVRQRLAASLARARGRITDERRRVAPAVTPTLAPQLAIDPERDARLLLSKQLADLESRRLALSDRLMPEHPEMKALDEKIIAVQSRLASRPYLEADHGPVLDVDRTPPVLAPSMEPDENEDTAELAGISAELLAAEEKYAAAVEQERSRLKQLGTARSRSLSEMEPARAAIVSAKIGWQTWFSAALCGLLTSGLVLGVWPVRRTTFSTVEEVGAVTRLPVIALSRAS
jgi:hypothetical protein